MSSGTFINPLALASALFGFALGINPADAATESTPPALPNVILITSDDLHWDTPGIGVASPVGPVMPNVRALADRGVTYTHGYLQATVCTPSRHAMLSGRYSHRTNTEGFVSIDPKIQTLPSILHGAGYHNAIINKGVNHYPWDFSIDRLDTNYGRDASVYRRLTTQLLKTASDKNKPLFLMANTMDPHRPYVNSDQEDIYGDFPPFKDKVPPPTKFYEPEEMVIPPFLSDLPEVRQELAEYHASSRRADDVIGAILEAIDAAGQWDNTLVIFLSDNAISMPFAKSNAYWFSARTPIVFAGHNVPASGEIRPEMIQAIDMMPTILHRLGLPIPGDLDGQLIPHMTDQNVAPREEVYVQFYQGTEVRRHPVYAIHTKKHSYIFNPWVDGKRDIGASDFGESISFKAMAQSNDPHVQARYQFHRHRTLEELYDNELDPGNLNNLIDDPAYREVADDLRSRLTDWFETTASPGGNAFAHRDNPAVLNQFIEAQLRDSLNRKTPEDREPVVYASKDWTKDTASWTQNDSNGIWIVEPRDGRYEVIEGQLPVPGVRAVDRDDAWRFLYFHVHDALTDTIKPASPETLGYPLKLKITFDGDDQSQLEVQYNSVKNRYHTVQPQSISAADDDGLRYAIYRIKNARFDNSQNGGADFRIRYPGGSEYTIFKIDVSK